MSRSSFFTIAHWELATPNSDDPMEQFQDLLESGYDGIAIDVCLGKPSVPVISSESTVNRKRIDQLTPSQLLSFGIPSLEQILNVATEEVQVVLSLMDFDDDSERLANSTLEVVRKFPNRSVTIACDHVDVVWSLRGEVDDLLGVATDKEALRNFQKWNLPVVGLTKNLASSQTIRRLVDDDIEVWIWGIDEDDDWNDFASLGVSGFVSEAESL